MALEYRYLISLTPKYFAILNRKYAKDGSCVGAVFFLCCLITEFRACGGGGGRGFAPAGATFFSLVGKEGKSTPRGKGTLSNGSPSPLEPPTLRNDQRGAEAPRLDFPAEAACPFGHCRPRARHSTVSRGEVRTDEHTILGESKGAPKGPLWSEGRGAGEGAFELPPLLPALLLTFAAAGKSKSPPQGRNTCSRRARRRGTLLNVSDYLLFKAFIISKASNFFAGVKLTQLSNNSFNSGVIYTISPSAKNCDNVIPNPLHMASIVGTDGSVFLRKTLAIVDSERPHSFASLYSVQLRSARKCRSRSCISIISLLSCNDFTVKLRYFIHFTCNLITVMLNYIKTSDAIK